MSTIKNHALPTGNEFKNVQILSSGYIWHLGYLKGAMKSFKTYLLNLNQSEIHSTYQICKWRDRHLLGYYPTKEISFNSLPKIIVDKFHLGVFDIKKLEPYIE